MDRLEDLSIRARTYLLEKFVIVRDWLMAHLDHTLQIEEGIWL